LTLATLGTPKEAQELDNLGIADSKRYIHHYNFPPYSTGEVKPLRGQSRREIGHGALAERALVPVIPDEKDFPYTLRLVSEVLASNGSSSMASVCGSTLALMDTGVPIKAPVAGIAMGLIKEADKTMILTDIQGMEDHYGDMDFKVAGTADGITALQMDIKIKGITPEIMTEALSQAKKARLFILDMIREIIPAPRPELKPHAPRITTIKIPVDKIGAIIGPGSKIIRAIQEETGAKIDIDDDGTVFIATADGVAEAAARERIERWLKCRSLAGSTRQGGAHRDFGAFGRNPSQHRRNGAHFAARQRTRREVEDVVAMGDEITVMVTGIDDAARSACHGRPCSRLDAGRSAVEGRDKRSGGGGLAAADPAAAVGLTAT